MAGSFPKDTGFGQASECQCWNSGANYQQFDRPRLVGVDTTEGRFADVTLEECRTCGDLWLGYQVEYEAFSKSGRWARRQICKADANEITPETALQYIEADQYAYGGTYFDGKTGWRSGHMHWGL